MRSELRRLALATVSAGALLAGAASAQTLTMGVRAGPESIDPHYTATGTHSEALKHVFDTLTALVRQSGLAAIVATHNLDLAARMDRRVTIRDGVVVELA